MAIPTICPTCQERLYNNDEIAFCENAHVFAIVKPKRKKEGKGTDAQTNHTPSQARQ